jgi:hypothetical protein
MALVNMMNFPPPKDFSALRDDPLLSELRILAHHYPEPTARKQLARGIARTTIRLHEERAAHSSFESLNEELRPLAAELPAKHVVNEVLRTLDADAGR